MQPVEGDLIEGGTVGEERLPVGEGGGAEGGEGLRSVLFVEGEIGETDFVTGDVEAGELRAELGKSPMECLLNVGSALAPNVPGGEQQKSR